MNNVAVDIAIAAMAVVCLAHGTWNYRLQMRIADRLRVVSPPKQKDQPAAEVKNIAARGKAAS